MANVGKVLIVGGGIAGMSCAIQLRKAGIEVDLIDVDPEWRIYGAGITITGPTLRALQTVGVLAEVIQGGATWEGGRVFNQAGEFLTTLDNPPLAADLPATGGIMRPVLHRILSAKTRALGTRVRLGATVADLRDHGDRVEVTLSDGAHSFYDLVVGSDGIFSKLRERAFPHAKKPVFTGQIVYRLLAERPAGFSGSDIFMGPDVKVGFNAVSATHMYMYLLHRVVGDPWIPPAEQPERLHAAMAGFGGFVPEVRATVRTTNAHSVNYRPLEVHLLPAPWHRGRVVLIGDAAHATTPHLASGAGMAVEDAIVLVEELRSRPTLDEAFAHFMERRFERCRLVIENSIELGRLEMNHGSPHVHAKLMSDTIQELRRPI